MRTDRQAGRQANNLLGGLVVFSIEWLIASRGRPMEFVGFTYETGRSDYSLIIRNHVMLVVVVG